MEVTWSVSIALDTRKMANSVVSLQSSMTALPAELPC